MARLHTRTNVHASMPADPMTSSPSAANSWGIQATRPGRRRRGRCTGLRVSSGRYSLGAGGRKGCWVGIVGQWSAGAHWVCRGHARGGVAPDRGGHGPDPTPMRALGTCNTLNGVARGATRGRGRGRGRKTLAPRLALPWRAPPRGGKTRAPPTPHLAHTNAHTHPLSTHCKTCGPRGAGGRTQTRAWRPGRPRR